MVGSLVAKPFLVRLTPEAFRYIMDALWPVTVRGKLNTAQLQTTAFHAHETIDR
jgi:hypothetical protein